MKRSNAILFIVVCVAVLFLSGHVIGTFTSININVNDPIGIAGLFTSRTTQTAVQPQTTAPQIAETTTTPATQPVNQTEPTQTKPAETETTAESTETTTTDKADNDETTTSAPEETTAAQTNDPSSLSKDEIVEKVNAAVNNLKNGQNFKATKTEKTVINITQCSVNSLTDMLNSICQKVAGEKTSTYEFSNGQAVGIGSDGKELNDGNPVTPKEALPPKKEDFKLDAAGVKEATAEKNGDSTTYTIKLINEDSTIDKAPQTNADALGYLNLGSFNIPTVTITQADIAYPESVIVVTVDSEGRVTNFKFDQPMEGSMGMKITLINGSADFNGGNYETWEFAY